jgi:3',5'-nucleoside bisphosphate phosphatase
VSPTPSPNATFDLHLHSSCSDGKLPPEGVLEQAARGGLDVIALTDHDLVGALEPRVHQVGGRAIRVLCGAEISGVHDGREFHLLVYFPQDAPPRFDDFCRRTVRARAERYEVARANIGLPGVRPAPPEAHAGDLALTRHHLARALVEAGHASDLSDAFARYTGSDNVPRLDLPFVECIREARACGGLTSWAHPPREAVERYLDTFVEAGLHGLEGMRPGLRRTDRRFYKKKARRHGLFLTGGSDSHGWRASERLGLFRLRGAELAPFLDALAA